MRPLLLTVLALAAVLTSCGGAKPAPRPTAACSVNVYFASHATHSQEKFVGSKLRNDRRIWRVSYVSKAQALAEMKKKFPSIVKASPIKTNPLPDSFVAIPLDPSEASAIGHSFKRAKWPGVADVKWPMLLRARRCG